MIRYRFYIITLRFYLLHFILEFACLKTWIVLFFVRDMILL